MFRRKISVSFLISITLALTACDAQKEKSSEENIQNSIWSLSQTKDPMTDSIIKSATATFITNPFQTEATVSCKGKNALYYDFTTYNIATNDPDSANIQVDTTFLNTGDPVIFYNYRVDSEEVTPASAVDIEFSNRLSIGPGSKNVSTEAAMGMAFLRTGLTGEAKRGPVVHSKTFSKANLLRIDIPLAGGNVQFNIDQTDPAIREVISACAPEIQRASVPSTGAQAAEEIDIENSSNEEMLAHFLNLSSKTIHKNAYYYSIDTWNGGCELGESLAYNPNDAKKDWDGSWTQGQEVAKFYVVSLTSISPDNIKSTDGGGDENGQTFTLSLRTGSSQSALLDVWSGTSDSAEGDIKWNYKGRMAPVNFGGPSAFLGLRERLEFTFVGADKPQAIAIFNELLKRCPYTDTRPDTHFKDSWKPGGTVYKRIVLRRDGSDVHEIVKTAATAPQEPQSPANSDPLDESQGTDR